MLREHREEAIREISKVLQSWYGELGLEIKRSLGEAEHSRKKKKKQLDKISEAPKSSICLAKNEQE